MTVTVCNAFSYSLCSAVASLLLSQLMVSRLTGSARLHRDHMTRNSYSLSFALGLILFSFADQPFIFLFINNY